MRNLKGIGGVPPEISLRDVLVVSAFAAFLLVACSSDSSSDDDSGVDAGSAADASQSDENTDTSTDSDMGARDAATNDTVGDCSAGSLACDGACGFNFTRVAPDRDGVNFVRLTFAPSPFFAVTSIVIENAPAEVRFSNAYGDYISRITNDEWVITDNGQGFVSGSPIEFTEPFEVEVLFEDLGGATEPDCPSGDRTDCGEVIVSGTDCTGLQQSIELNIRR